LAALGHGRHTLGGKAALRVAGADAGGPFRPAVEASGLDLVDLVVAAEPEVARGPVVAGVETAQAVEGESLRVPKAPGDHLPAPAVLTHAQDLAAQVARVRGTRRDEPFAGGQVKEPVRAELEPAAEVVAGAAGYAVEQ